MPEVIKFSIFRNPKTRLWLGIKRLVFANQYRIGNGGMSVVYKQNTTRGKEIAVKVATKDDLLSSPNAEYFIRNEIKALSQFKHPNIVAYHGRGKIPGGSFLAIEYLPARDLRTHVSQKGPLSPKDAMFIAEKSASALLYIHEKGLVHGDVKPHNILWAKTRRKKIVKLIDFAMATQMGRKVKPEKGDNYCGTPGYVTVERLNGEAPQIRDDIFALGVSLYEVLTGERAVPGRHLMAAHDQLGNRIWHSYIPEPVKELLLRMTGTSPQVGDRGAYYYKNCRELLRDIKRVKKQLAKSDAKKLRPAMAQIDIIPTLEFSA
jgi:serine/threonine-protein kinase